MMNKAQQSHILVFSDFDGTIIDINTYKISSELTKFLKRNKKITLVLTTSRAWDGVAPYSKALNLTPAQITENGAVIIDPVTLEIVYKKTIPSDAEEAVKKLAKERRITISFAGDGKQVGRISLVMDLSKAERIIEDLKEIPNINFVAERQAGSEDKFLIDITPQSVNKYTGVLEWLRLYPGRYEKIYAAGNSLSDLPLFQTDRFIKVAVEDGAPELKCRADLVIPGPSEQGFLRLLYSLSPSSLSRSWL